MASTGVSTMPDQQESFPACGHRALVGPPGTCVLPEGHEEPCRFPESSRSPGMFWHCPCRRPGTKVWYDDAYAEALAQRDAWKRLHDAAFAACDVFRSERDAQRAELLTAHNENARLRQEREEWRQRWLDDRQKRGGHHA